MLIGSDHVCLHCHADIRNGYELTLNLSGMGDRMWMACKGCATRPSMVRYHHFTPKADRSAWMLVLGMVLGSIAANIVWLT